MEIQDGEENQTNEWNLPLWCKSSTSAGSERWAKSAIAPLFCLLLLFLLVESALFPSNTSFFLISLWALQPYSESSLSNSYLVLFNRFQSFRLKNEVRGWVKERRHARIPSSRLEHIDLLYFIKIYLTASFPTFPFPVELDAMMQSQIMLKKKKKGNDAQQSGVKKSPHSIV